jgi:hypothetical protein
VSFEGPQFRVRLAGGAEAGLAESLRTSCERLAEALRRRLLHGKAVARQVGSRTSAFRRERVSAARCQRARNHRRDGRHLIWRQRPGSARKVSDLFGFCRSCAACRSGESSVSIRFSARRAHHAHALAWRALFCPRADLLRQACEPFLRPPAPRAAPTPESHGSACLGERAPIFLPRGHACFDRPRCRGSGWQVRLEQLREAGRTVLRSSSPCSDLNQDPRG